LTNTRIENSLIIEGPFNFLTIHKHAFHGASINELIIGCYCIECESFSGDCNVKFNQPTKYPNRFDAQPRANTLDESKFSIRSIKLFSVSLNLTLENLPSIRSVEELEITNAKEVTFPSLSSFSTYQALQKFTFKNNRLAELAPLVKVLNSLRQMKYLVLAQNSLSRLDDLNGLLPSRFLLELNLERNQIQEMIRLRKFANLKVLNMNSNRLRQLDDFQFQDLVNLQVLDLSHNRLSFLNRNTLYGLKNLKQLSLSFNPFKSFAADSFKFVPGLTRLDLVSNTDSDWFTFDNEDVCLLTHLTQCQQIRFSINSEQVCNCFVKYLSLIASQTSAAENCQYEQHQYKNLNKFVDEMNRFYHERDLDEETQKAPVTRSPSSSLLQSFREACFAEYLSKCESNRSSLCLDTAFSGDRVLTSSETVIKYNSAKLNTDNSEVYEAERSSEGDSGEESAIFSVFAMDKMRADTGVVMLLLVGLLFVFALSFASLLIGIILMLKRNKYSVYTVASSGGYPNDER
jgi:hypothetical protein